MSASSWRAHGGTFVDDSPELGRCNAITIRRTDQGHLLIITDAGPCVLTATVALSVADSLAALAREVLTAPSPPPGSRDDF